MATKKTIKEILDKEPDYISYLDELRDSGVTNMYGAVPFLQRKFMLDKEEAKRLLREWMEGDR